MVRNSHLIPKFCLWCCGSQLANNCWILRDNGRSPEISMIVWRYFQLRQRCVRKDMMNKKLGRILCTVPSLCSCLPSHEIVGEGDTPSSSTYSNKLLIKPASNLPLSEDIELYTTDTPVVGLLLHFTRRSGWFPHHSSWQRQHRWLGPGIGRSIRTASSSFTCP